MKEILMVLCTCCWRNQSISTFCLCVSESRDCMISWGREAQQENEDEEEEARLLTESRNGLWFSRFWNSWMRKPSSIQWREPIKQSWGPKSMLPKHVFSAPQVIYMYMGKENPRKNGQIWEPNVTPLLRYHFLGASMLKMVRIHGNKQE